MEATAHIVIHRRPKNGVSGLDGCILRNGEWASGVEYHNDQDIPKGIKYLDIAVITIGVDQYECYQCLEGHTSSAANRPGTDGGKKYWKPFNNLQPIFTPLVIAQNALLKFSQTNQLLVMKNDGITVAAGMGGGAYPLWVGATTPEGAPFKVGIDGSFISTKADIEGKITASEGKIGGFLIGSNRIGAETSIDQETGSGMGLYDDFINFRNTYRSATIGTDAIPASSGFTGVARFCNKTWHDVYDMSPNVGIMIDVSGATMGDNWAIWGNGDIKMDGKIIITGRIRCAAVVSEEVAASTYRAISGSISEDGGSYQYVTGLSHFIGKVGQIEVVNGLVIQAKK